MSDERPGGFHRILAPIFLATFLLSTHLVGDTDLFWQIRTGREMWEQKTIQAADSFSFSYAGAPWTFHSPLSNLGLYFVHRFWGFAGISFVTAILLAAASVMLVKNAGPKSGEPVCLVMAVVLLAVWLVRPQLETPVHLMAVLFLAMFSVVSRTTWEGSYRAAWTYGVLLSVWIFLHPSYLLGFVWAVLVCIRWRREGMSRTGVSGRLLVILLLPATIFFQRPDAFLDVLNHLSADSMRQHVIYWKHLFQPNNFSDPRFWTLIFWMTLCLIFVFQRSRPDHENPWRLEGRVMTVLLAVLSLGGIRFYPLFVFFSLPSVIRLCAGHSKREYLKTLLMAAFAFFSIADTMNPNLSSWGFGLDKSRVPLQAIEFVKLEDIRGNVFNSYNFGGVLIFYLPQHRVFIDPRSVQVYPDAFIQRFMAAYSDPAEFERIVSEFNIQWTFLNSASPTTQTLIKHLGKSSKWRLVFFDKQAAIYVIRPEFR